MMIDEINVADGIDEVVEVAEVAVVAALIRIAARCEHDQVRVVGPGGGKERARHPQTGVPVGIEVSRHRLCRSGPRPRSVDHICDRLLVGSEAMADDGIGRVLHDRELGVRHREELLHEGEKAGSLLFELGVRDAIGAVKHEDDVVARGVR